MPAGATVWQVHQNRWGCSGQCTGACVTPKEPGLGGYEEVGNHMAKPPLGWMVQQLLRLSRLLCKGWGTLGSPSRDLLPEILRGREEGAPCHLAHLPREVAVLVEGHILVLLAVHAKPCLESLAIGPQLELQLTQAVEELG